MSTGYFLWDLLVSTYEGWGVAFIAHAVACTFVYASAMAPFLHWHGLFFLLFEASTPFLHLRWLLIKLGWTKGLMFPIVNYGFALAFFLVRLAIGWPVSFYWWGDMLHLLTTGTAHSPATVVGYLTCNIVLNGLNALWFFKIVKSATGGSSKRDETGMSSSNNGKAKADKGE